MSACLHVFMCTMFMHVYAEEGVRAPGTGVNRRLQAAMWVLGPL